GKRKKESGMWGCRQWIAAAMLTAAMSSAFGQNTGTVPSARQWSGESGASGHPEMTARAIRAAAADFNRCIAGLWPQAARRGISRAAYRAATADLTPDLKLMDFMDAQPEFTKSF